MRNVVSVWDNNKVLGTVKGLTFYNVNGATKTFQNEWQMKNYLNSFGATIQKQLFQKINFKKVNQIWNIIPISTYTINVRENKN